MDPTAVAKLLQEGLTLHRLGRLRDAMEIYVRVLKDHPENADALYYVAVAAMQEGDTDNGIKLAERALGFNPKLPRAHNLLGQGLHRAGRLDEALASFERAIELQADFADAHGNRASVLAELGRSEEAVAGFDRALGLRESPDDLCNRGAALHDLERLDEALASYQHAITLRPNFAGAYLNHSDILRDLGQMEDAAGKPSDQAFDAAEQGYSAAIEINPQFADAFLGRGLLRLTRGDWEKGFRDFEYRTRVPPPTFVPLDEPRWRGEDFTGERLVLVTEQGLGDTINMCRFAPVLAKRGFDVTILTGKAMAPLLSTLPDVSIATSVDELKKDPRPIRWLPLMSVPGVLGITPDTIPADVPYLKAEPERIAKWSAALVRPGGGFKIGINWASGHSHVRGFLKRNVPIEAFSAVAMLPGVRLISLQKGPAAADIKAASFGAFVEQPATDPNPEADFFLDTAALMSDLDLIVTCDTAVAHLAGALGRPVLVALPAVADWRWLTGRDDSPWYPTMRLHRQRLRGQWADVMARIADAAHTLSAPRTIN